MTTTLADTDVGTTLAVTVTALQTIALGRRPTAEATVQTQLHIPGSVLRGALAGAWLAEYGEPDPQRSGRTIIPASVRAAFLELFEGPIRYGPLLRPGSYLTPLSVHRCKYPRTPECKAAAIDEAFSDLGDGRCPACKGVLEAARGEIESADDLLTEKTRVALTPGETAQEGLLYSRRALRARDAKGQPVTFTGHLLSTQGTVPGWLSQQRRLHLGGRRSTEGGADYATNPVQLTAGGTDNGRIVLRLLSPALLVDHAGRPDTHPDERLISDLLGVPVVLGRSWTRSSVVGGWHAASNLPKPEEIAVSAGSVFELKLPAAPAEPDGVAALLAHGLGLRRGEGYGWTDIAAGPWQPAQPVTPDPPVPPFGLVADMAATLYGSGHGRWLLNELRAFLAACEGTRRPPPYLLQRPQLETAVQDVTFHRRLELLLTKVPPGQIRQVIEALDVHVRGGRR